MAVQKESNGKSSPTRVAFVMDHIRHRIAQKNLAPGARLPSLRKNAQALGVSKSTMVDAYDRLAAEGVIEARRGAGFFVLGNSAPLVLADNSANVVRDIDPLWVSRQSLEADEAAHKPGCGWLPPSWMPEESVRRAMRQLSRARSEKLFDYGTPLGLAPLRRHILQRMEKHKLVAAPEQVMLTSSGTQAIDLLCRFFLEPGDCVVVDDPCYFNFHALLRAHRVKVVGVPFTQTGPDLEKFESAIGVHRPRLYITNSAIHNPTGAVLSPVVAHQVLKLAEKADMVIIEDDIFADLENTPAPRLAALDGLNRVVQIGSFSKTLSAAARCGFVCARSDWIEGLLDLKIATSFGGDPMAAALTWQVLKDVAYRRHLKMLRSKLSGAMAQTCARLKELNIQPWIMPRAGMYVWCALPGQMPAIEMARKAHAKGVILAPGNVFSPEKRANHFLRFNVAQSGADKIYDVLGDILSQQK